MLLKKRQTLSSPHLAYSENFFKIKVYQYSLRSPVTLSIVSDGPEGEKHTT